MFTCTKPDCHYFFDFDGSGGLGALKTAFPMSPFIGGWVLLAIVAASMSTGDGAILAMSTVFSHNLLRKLPVAFLQDDKNLVTVARLATIIWAVAGGLIAGIAPDATGYFLIFAFDIMLSGSVVPMFAAVYWKAASRSRPSSPCSAARSRLILEYTIEKDFLLLLVGKYAKSFGPGSYAGLGVETGVLSTAGAAVPAQGSDRPRLDRVADGLSRPPPPRPGAPAHRAPLVRRSTPSPSRPVPGVSAAASSLVRVSTGGQGRRATLSRTAAAPPLLSVHKPK